MTEMISMGVAVLGVLAFVVSVITELIKNLGKLYDIPTDAVVIVLSEVLSIVAFFGYNTYAARVFVWYELVAAIIAGFIVAFISMYGWDKLTELYERFSR